MLPITYGLYSTLQWSGTYSQPSLVWYNADGPWTLVSDNNFTTNRYTVFGSVNRVHTMMDFAGSNDTYRLSGALSNGGTYVQDALNNKDGVLQNANDLIIANNLALSSNETIVILCSDIELERFRFDSYGYEILNVNGSVTINSVASGYVPTAISGRVENVGSEQIIAATFSLTDNSTYSNKGLLITPTYGGYLYEVMIWNRHLSQSELDDVFGYLKNKWYNL